MAEYRFIYRFYDDLPGATGQRGSYRIVDVQVVDVPTRRNLQQSGRALYSIYSLVRGYSSAIIYYGPVRVIGPMEPYDNPYLSDEERERIANLVRTYGLDDDWKMLFEGGPLNNIIYVGDDGAKPTFAPLTRFIDP